MAAASPQSQEVAQQQQPATPAQSLVQRIRGEGFQRQIAYALPENVRPERFIRAAATALLDKPEIAEADIDSVFSALLKAAQDGLLPDGREATINVYNVKGVPTAQYLPMVAGLRRIAGEHGWRIRTGVVYEKDEFEFSDGLVQDLRHVPPRPGVPRGERIAAYAVGVHRDGRTPEVKVLDAGAIAKARAKSKTPKVWEEWPDQMFEKTAAKSLFKRLELDKLDERVARIIAAAEGPLDASVAALYGPEAARELTPGEPEPADVEGERASQTLPDRQVGDAASGAAASPAPDSDDEPGPSEPPDDEATRAHAEAAGRVTVPAGTRHHAGQSIAAIHALGEDGEKWLAWALNPKRAWNKDDNPNAIFGQAVRAYVEHFLPELVKS